MFLYLYELNEPLASYSRVARLAWTRLTTKTKIRGLGSFYTEFESSRVELRVTYLTREFWVLVPRLSATPPTQAPLLTTSFQFLSFFSKTIREYLASLQNAIQSLN
jgi:hypothetical protein